MKKSFAVRRTNDSFPDRSHPTDIAVHVLEGSHQYLPMVSEDFTNQGLRSLQSQFQHDFDVDNL